MCGNSLIRLKVLFKRMCCVLSLRVEAKVRVELTEGVQVWGVDVELEQGEVGG